MKQRQEYYIGLDCGTSSVGWAATDEKYNLLKTKRKVKKNDKTKSKQCTLWGVRLFDEAETAAERRVFRSARRRTRRTKDRLKLLRLLFRDEMLKVDPEFYQRLRESFYYEEDKNLQQKSKNTLFNDKDFSDKDFHKVYPTIWHLRRAIVHASPDQHFDLRLYFLAIQHFFKHRGHFLFDGELKNGRGDFEKIFTEFCDTAKNYSFEIEPTCSETVERIIVSDQNLTEKKQQLKNLALFLEDEEDEDEKLVPQRQKALLDLVAGGKVNLSKLFTLETDEKCGYSLGQLEEKEAEIAEKITLDNMPLLIAAKQIYDYGILDKILGENKFISDAMVANYDQHKQDLKALKDIFRPYPEIYAQLFKDNKYNKKGNKFDASKNPSYGAYVSRDYQVEGGRKGHVLVSQEDFNKHLKKLLEEIGYSGELLDRAEKGELLPKQRGQSKGTIPQQLHHNELEIILGHLAQDYPSFVVETPGEAEAYNTKCKKLALIHSFRIPYYCGPLVKRKYDDYGNPLSNGKSQFSWNDEEITELVRPWNFDQLVNKSKLADQFIRRMTNECTYLLGEEVLPKSSLLYQKYMVLNELNNLRVDGRPLDVNLKQNIYQRAFLDGEILGNITFRKFEKYLKDNSFIPGSATLSGTSEAKILPQLKTYRDFQKILGADFQKKYSSEKLEKVIEAITILGDEREMLTEKIAGLLSLPHESIEVKRLAKLSYHDWGKFSAKFLSGITVDNCTVLDWLYESEHNLQQLLGQEVGFAKVVDEHNMNSGQKPQLGAKLKYSDVQNLYCSPAVKRSVWQTIKIVDELVKNQKSAPAKIFLEVTRGEAPRAKENDALTRRKELEEKLKAIKTDDAREILKEISDSNRTDRDLQSKKLFLYFSQMGKCAYSGNPINLEDINNTSLYDIDHIYPRSKTKDDSIRHNLVLVEAKLNRDKTNTYPINDSIRSKMSGIWRMWYAARLITKEKYERLVRSTPLTPDELGGFIARQIVETSQTVKAIRDLLKRAYPETEIVMVKAGQVSDFRHYFANGTKYHGSEEYKVAPRPEFIKVRELNDYHHAKDAYLNIVVGNVMNSTFTSDPYEWVKNREGREYSIRTDRIFRDSYEYEKRDGGTTHYPEVEAWDFANSIALVSDTMKRNDILWTRMSYVESGAISDQQIVGKTQKVDGILPIKRDRRLVQVDKYGGYNSVKGAFFTLIECSDKKGNTQRRIVSVPQVYSSRIEDFVHAKYSDAKVIIPTVKFKTLLRLNNFPVHLAGKSGSGLIFHSAKQLQLNENQQQYIKKLSSVDKKNRESRGGYEIDPRRDGVGAESNSELLSALCSKLVLFSEMPGFQEKVKEIQNRKEDFQKLDLKMQIETLLNFVKMLRCNAETGDISSFVPRSSFLGKATGPEDIVSKSNSAELINQSPAGLYEEVIDLKTVRPKSRKSSNPKTKKVE